MRILFITLSNIEDVNNRSLYNDLLRILNDHGHEIYVISPRERRLGLPTEVSEQNGIHILKMKTGNITKTNLIEKGISTIALESLLIHGIKKHFSQVKFDLVLYSTPPITFNNAVAFVKKRDGAASYLMLKDIFPQNAVDLGMFSKASPIYKYFRSKEQKLYQGSDFIGCTSKANIDYVCSHNPGIDPAIVHIFPNSIDASQMKTERTNAVLKEKMKANYGIPPQATVFLYGGNLGKPQGIPFFIDCLKKNANREDRFFIISGTGTDFGLLQNYMEENKPNNMLLINGLPREEYEQLTACCDVGLVFLNHKFTVPNTPSRILPYMENRLPIIACTDPATDLGRMIQEGDFGWWCESNDAAQFTKFVDEACVQDLAVKGENGYAYLKHHFTTQVNYRAMAQRVLEK